MAGVGARVLSGEGGKGFSAEHGHIYLNRILMGCISDCTANATVQQVPMRSILAVTHISRCRENGPGPSLLLLWNLRQENRIYIYIYSRYFGLS